MIAFSIALILIGMFLAVLITSITYINQNNNYCVKSDVYNPSVDCSRHCVIDDPTTCSLDSTCINFPIDSANRPCK
jgi:hypothetical protein